MDAWRPKHVEDYNAIKWKWKCVKLVTLLWFFIIFRSFLLRMMFQTKVVHKIKTHFLFCKILKNSFCLWGKEKHCRAGQATDDNMAHYHAGYLGLQTRTRNVKHILFFQYNEVCTTEPEFALYVHWLSCWVTRRITWRSNWENFVLRSFINVNLHVVEMENC
jgi:hypothetical protein